MTAQVTSAIARIRQANQRVVGAGFLVSDKHILTCAHVVNAALKRSLNALEEPNQALQLDFPLVASGKILRGRVVRWIPVQPSSSILPEAGADIALLELESPLPEGTQPVRLIQAENLWKHPFRVFGFPEGQPGGISTDGIIRERQANSRVHIEVPPSYSYFIESGFSGSPVWDEQLDGVVGMTVAIDPLRPENRAAFMTPTTQLIDACPELAEQAIPPCPYRGLFAFREQDAKFFFGRKTFTQQLVKEVRKKFLVAVIGASGSGKSSVVFAGLIPQLRSEEGWLIKGFRPGDCPFYNLADRLVPLLETEMSKTAQLIEIQEQAKAFKQGKLKLRNVVKSILENNSGSRLLLIADQFEELYTLCQENSERQIFLDQLLEAVNQTENFKLVLTLRADFFGYALSYRPFADALQDADRKLGPMNPEELQEVIEKPAQLLGVRIESGLTERILEAVENEPGNLPLLEFALTLLWAKQQNGQLTHEAYEEIGGVEKALAEYAEEQYESLSEEDKQRAQRVFIQLVCPGEGTEDTRRLATRDEVGEDNWDLVTRLASARLVVTNRTEKTDEKEKTDQETVEVIHDSLIRHWQQLRQWVNENREAIRIGRRIETSAEEWQSQGKPEEMAFLLQGSKLAEAENFLQDYADLGLLSSLSQEFIQVSQDTRERLHQEEEARQQRELDYIRELLKNEQQTRQAQSKALAEERKARKADRDKFRFAIVAIVLAIATIAAGAFAWQWQQQLKFGELLLNTYLKILEPNEAELLLKHLPNLLEKADTYKRKGDIKQALFLYHKILPATRQLQRQIKEEPENFQKLLKSPEERSQGIPDEIPYLYKNATQSLVDSIRQEPLEKLKQELKNNKIGDFLSHGEYEEIDMKNRHTEGALKTTYNILMKEFGAKADLNSNDTLDSKEEAEQIPCETLHDIQYWWCHYTDEKCGWYGSNSDYLAQDTKCEKLDGFTLTQKIFIFPFESEILERLNNCNVASPQKNINE